MKRFIKTVFATTLIGLTTHAYAAAPDSTSTSISPAERAKIEEVVHQYLLSKPEVVMEAIQVLQQRQYQEAEKTVKETQQIVSKYNKDLFHQANDPIVGNAQGKVTVTEFFDYQCPHCVDMAPVIVDIVKANPDVRIVFKELPIRGPMSETAARAALAANKQGKYYEFSHALLSANKPITEEVIFTVAKDQGLNVDQLKKDMNDASVKDKLAANKKLAQELKLFGTPAIFIGKTTGTTITYVPGQMTKEQLQSAIDAAK